MDDLYDSLDEQNEKFITIHAHLADHIILIENKLWEAAAATATRPFDAAATAASSSAGTPGRFVDTSLKPFTLTKAHNLQELRRWCKAFIRYFESGPLILQPISRQRGFLELCLDTELVMDLESFITHSTPYSRPRRLPPDPGGSLPGIPPNLQSLHQAFRHYQDERRGFVVTPHPGEISRIGC